MTNNLNLTDNKKRDIIKYMESDKPLPEKYRFLLFDVNQEVELLWNGKTDEMENTVLLFQAIEDIDEPRSQEKEYLVQGMVEKLKDEHSLGFYRKVVDLIPENLIWQALSEVKDAHLTGRVKKSKAALFTTVIKSNALKHSINFVLNK